MYEITDKFTEAMIPILERESNLAWGPQSVGRIVKWTCKESACQIVDDAFLSELRALAANYTALLRRLNYLLEGGEGITSVEAMDLAAKMQQGVSFPLQHLMDMLWPNEAHATQF